MRIGAKIVLNTGIDNARDGLAALADSGWMMNLPRRQEAYYGPSAGHPTGHPAGRARPGLPASEGGPGPVAVTFGKPAPSGGSGTALPVQWESMELGDEFTVLLDGDITLTPAADQGHSTLTLAGFCRLPEGTLTVDGYAQARAQVTEAARTFMSSVAATAARCADPGGEPEPSGPAWSWLTGLPPDAEA
jgi:hypothetical protein